MPMTDSTMPPFSQTPQAIQRQDKNVGWSTNTFPERRRILVFLLINVIMNNPPREKSLPSNIVR